ncbi:hypothetical protein [Burkholderia ambifaria]|uniref:hypothetical protein n=1 Tax=Burkholderia ambifaria TaxID=152480 RepID=UPI001FC7C6BC|nr:hypothetical protein [Burkholderia ambifaria]
MTDRPLVALLIARLTGTADHPRFTGTPIDLSTLDAHALGAVWPALRRVEHEIMQRDHAYDDPRGEFARWLRQQIDALGLVPLVDDDAALELFRDIPAGGWKRALEDLPCLDALPSPALQAELARIVAEPEEGRLRAVSAYGAYALDWFAGRRDFSARRDAYAQALADSPFRVRELDVLPELGPAALLALAATNDGYFAPKRLWIDYSDPAVTLAQDAAYVAFARDALTDAARQVAALHAGAVPYEADRAFTTDDAQVVARRARGRLSRRSLAAPADRAAADRRVRRTDRREDRAVAIARDRPRPCGRDDPDARERARAARRAGRRASCGRAEEARA